MNKKVKETKIMRKVTKIKPFQRYINGNKYVVKAENLEEANVEFEKLEQKLANSENNDNN